MSATTTPAASRLTRVRSALTRGQWATVGGMVATIIGLTVLGWGMFGIAVLPAHVKALGIGIAFLAYTLGMRHAFDADHISAIDNTTRKLMAQGQRPLTVGFFFSLGHSTIVFLLGVGLTFAARAIFGQVKNPNSALEGFGGLFGTSVSGVFLYIIAVLNVVILIGIIQVFVKMRRGRYNEAELEKQLNSRGMMNRFFGGLMRTVNHPWQMYPIGVLFGLGFDTATEVALLAATAGAATSGLPWYAVVSLPILFAAGMSLFDTSDGCFMNFAYGWAFAKPIRKVYYNIVITSLSVAVALFIGSIELIGLIGVELHLNGPVWGPIENFDINKAGFIIVGIFVATWAIALAIWYGGRIESRWSNSTPAQ